MGAKYSLYVKSIATFAPTFYGHIISLLASVHNDDDNLHFMGGVDKNWQIDFNYDLHFLLNFVGASLDPGTKPVFAGYSGLFIWLIKAEACFCWKWFYLNFSIMLNHSRTDELGNVSSVSFGNLALKVKDFFVNWTAEMFIIEN